MNLTVIIPVYNEIKTIAEIVQRVQAIGAATEIVIVDDGSTDGTRDFLKTLENDPQVRVILHEHNQGKGAAVRTGIQAATGDVLIIQDADLEYDPRDIRRYCCPIEEGIADVVFGSRFLGGARASNLVLEHGREQDSHLHHQYPLQQHPHRYGDRL